MTVDRRSVQESLYPELTCFGCGHANPDGFHLRSYVEGDLVVAEFTPRPEHDNGFGFVNGGIITTVLDCHGAAVVMWEAEQRGWEAAPGAPVPFITAGFDVRFLRPTPLGPPVHLTAIARTHRRVGDRRALRAVGRRQGARLHVGRLAAVPAALKVVSGRRGVPCADCDGARRRARTTRRAPTSATTIV